MPLKPLTDGEIAALRERAWESDAWSTDDAEAVTSLLDWVTRARTLLRRIEFDPVCPVCRMYRVKGCERDNHAPDCELAALLGSAAVFTQPATETVEEVPHGVVDGLNREFTFGTRMAPRAEIIVGGQPVSYRMHADGRTAILSEAPPLGSDVVARHRLK